MLLSVRPNSFASVATSAHCLQRDESSASSASVQGCPAFGAPGIETFGAFGLFPPKTSCSPNASERHVSRSRASLCPLGARNSPFAPSTRKRKRFPFISHSMDLRKTSMASIPKYVASRVYTLQARRSLLSTTWMARLTLSERPKTDLGGKCALEQNRNQVRS